MVNLERYPKKFPELHSYVKLGQPARLFSSLKSSNKEQIATSTLLSIFRFVPELLAELVCDAGVRINDRSVLHTLTEVTLAKKTGERDNRPDGFLYLKNRKYWTALVEAKVGNNALNPKQIGQYLKAAQINKIDALITISNEFSPRIDQSPVKISGRLPKNVKLYHFSWRLILSKAQLLKQAEDLIDREKSSILTEFIRFLNDESVGNKSFSMMPNSWEKLCNDVSSLSGKTKLRANNPYLPEVASALVEEFSEIALILTDNLGVDCTLKLPRNFLKDRGKWQKSIQSQIAKGRPLICQYMIPNAANPLTVELNIANASFTVGMEIAAPGHRATNKGKVSWLLKQMEKGTPAKNSAIIVRWNSRAADEIISIDKNAYENIARANRNSTIIAFTPMISMQSDKIFKHRKRFITELEKTVCDFYNHQACHLKPWVPSPPPPIEPEEIE